MKIDPAISARLLKIVNSPLYGFPRQIDTISRAVNLIGMQAVNDLVAATTIGRTFTGMTSDLMDLSAYLLEEECVVRVDGRGNCQSQRHR